MCEECNIINIIFDVAIQGRHKNYYPTLQSLEALEKQKKIELFAGDCQLSEALNILKSEQHYTVCHYLKCSKCDQFFFLGACVRGTPIYKLIDNVDNENLSNIIWGNVGTKYK